MRLGIATTLIALLQAAFLHAAPASVYTDLIEPACKLTAQAVQGEGDWSTFMCPGIDGYTLEILDDDARQNLRIHHKSFVSDLNLTGQITGGFHHLGKKAEWRLVDGKAIALIVRMHIQESDPPVKREVLIISRIESKGTCVTQVINASSENNANELARKAADSASSQKCLWLNKTPGEK